MPMKTGVAWEGLALEDKEQGGGRWAPDAKLASAPMPASHHGREACLWSAGGQLTHRREGKSTGLRGRSRRKHISIHISRKGTSKCFQPHLPISGHGLTYGKGDSHPLSCPGKPLHTLWHKRHKRSHCYSSVISS